MRALIPECSKATGWQAKFHFRFLILICDYRCRATSRAHCFRYNRDYDVQRPDSGRAVRELSGCICRRERLFHRCRLLCANDARADVRENAGVNPASSRFRKFSRGNDSAHDRAARLPHSRVVDPAETLYDTRIRSGWGAYFAAARFTDGLVFMVVVAANEISLRLANADSVRDQSDSCSRNRVWPA